MVAKKSGKSPRKIKNLPAKKVSAKKGDAVKGGRAGGDKPVKY